ncbi:MAG: hypothetical protein UW43_C0007G0008 [Candidatus Yanofskybacteria bacterium GW2011_GWA1_44_21]|uniref:Glycosyltransferase 2-like domain-containing protein n=2 Tax=Candidatus Yanofskyibacteriota TaxID=1752733 RepID=A0A1F8H029_9BACT|nr:MAG: hypothetical protein UW14_C0017G0002 [Candidatus Yanofskybacteria bacterium GW2011_GWA2_44_10]KKT50391.1 MAG: hypothetical protein UW43_C0007G0008 [Candidatus Yanofskybacteria bacterium GW2011_GWA1_44_21]KKT89984.1 MAG: hypothetical protein UW90_C0009G0008 [Candidatus Yanofskybacteria bacterium GW2011_GWB1_45_11]OGN03372.1 MAG: hypothetical protein A2657_00040 [Candidatus Yanofskybacteria bacterium RIFCSPHIGHO2_01_FULL_44_110b]OGN14719.1 MAG: hypothetical protein A3C01_02140 [Candidatus
MIEYLHVGKAADLSDYKDRRIYRILEILPGFLAWATLIAIVAISFYFPFFTALFIIVFDIYWLIKTIYLSLLMRAAFFKMKANLRVDWHERLNRLQWQDIYHLVILPFATEPIEVLRESFKGLIKAEYPLDKMIVVLAREERVIGSKEIAEEIEKEYGSRFYKFLITSHPDGQEGEIRGKGSNETWAGQRVKNYIIDPAGIPYEKIVVSVFDIDTIVHQDFFSCLTWNYLTAEKPLKSSFQPIPLFINNIWEAPAFARVFAFSTTFWQMIQQSRPEQLVTFSSQSISFKALVDVGFWQKNVVSEDSRIFWQCLLRYDGDWRTVPMYFPVNMDANVAPTFWKTLKNQYKQILRWHYGAENNPYFMFGFLKNKKIPRKTKWHQTFVTAERTHSSATNAIIIFLLGWLPITLGGESFTTTILSYNLPRITGTIMNIAMLGLVTSAIISITLLPPRPPNYGKFKAIWMVLQWILFPINFIFFGAVPSLHAQTKLMFGKYMGFWVTPKLRK